MITSRYIDPSLRAIVQFATRHAKLGLSSPAQYVHAFFEGKKRDAKFRAADLIGHPAVAKFNEGGGANQPPSAAELIEIILGTMPGMSRATLETLPDSALVELAAACSDLITRQAGTKATNQSGGVALPAM